MLPFALLIAPRSSKSSAMVRDLASLSPSHFICAGDKLSAEASEPSFLTGDCHPLGLSVALPGLTPPDDPRLVGAGADCGGGGGVVRIEAGLVALAMASSLPLLPAIPGAEFPKSLSSPPLPRTLRCIKCDKSADGDVTGSPLTVGLAEQSSERDLRYRNRCEVSLPCPSGRRQLPHPDFDSRIAPPRAGGDGGGGGAVLDAEFGVDLLEMLIHRSWAEAEDLRDVPIGFSLGQPRQHLALTGGQSEFTGKFRGQIGAGIFCQPQQELIRTELAHVLQPQLLVVRKRRHGRGFRSGLALLSLFEPLQHRRRQRDFVIGPGGEVIRQ